MAIPTWSFRKTGVTQVDADGTELGHVRYGQLPGEAVCSENVTPWSKLLPCKNLAGLASLLRPTSLFRSNYIALKMTFRRVCWVGRWILHVHPPTGYGLFLSRVRTRSIADRGVRPEVALSQHPLYVLIEFRFCCHYCLND